ncbi:MAG: hypothetical protein QM756_04165 [Polyangiaceae bacterium]
MAELREDSLLFSLENLMVRERERVQLERSESERLRAQEAAEAARREQQRLEAALARERKLEQERLAEQRRLAEHAAKLEALRQAEVVRAQSEAQARAHSEELAQRHAHERTLAELSLRAKHTRDRAVALGSGALLSLFVPAALLFHFAHTVPQAQKTELELKNLLELERSRANEASQQLSRSETRRKELNAELDSVRNAAPPSKAQPTVAAPSSKAPHVTAPSTLLRPPGKPCRDSGDPLDPCLH